MEEKDINKKRYNRYNSNYILRKKHQTIDGGVIYERDWVTIGAKHKFEKGKTPIYYDGNFLFTNSSIKSTNKKIKYDSEEEEFTLNDITSNNKNAKRQINSNDIRDFAYYGSGVELIRTSVENIIKNFPGEIRLSSQEVNLKFKKGSAEKTYMVLNNPFNIDVYHEQLVDIDGINMMRFMSYSWKKYLVNGKDIEDYKVVLNFNEGDNLMCDFNTHCLYTIKINSRFYIYVFMFGESFIYVTDKNSSKVESLTPKQEFIEEYFENIEGFEYVLLNRKSRPLYTSELLTPIETNIDYKYANRLYTWPSNGYCIDIDSPSYYSYISKLLKLGKLYDELWTDNLYRNMTHEAIKNYDWTYSREFTPGDEQDNSDGGNRIEKLLRIYGRCFDDIKFDIDRIKKSKSITYDNFGADNGREVVKQLQCNGLDVLSLVGNLDRDYKYVDSGHYGAFDMSRLDVLDFEKEMLKRLLLSSSYILSRKGTRNSIEILLSLFGFNENEYSIKEEYYKVSPISDEAEINKCIVTNSNKNTSFLYPDDEFSGIPLKLVQYSHKKVLVPYIDNNKFYDGDIFYHSNGGWGYNENDTSYMETVPYLYMVESYQMLEDIDIHSLKHGDIYYVENIDTYLSTDEGQQNSNDYTNYFICEVGEEDINWLNIKKSDKTNLKRAEYLYSIIGTNFGNNPHVGYGKYDNGKEYEELLNKPFNKACELGFLDKKENAKMFNAELNTSDDKCFIALNNKGDINYDTYLLNSKVITIEFTFAKFKDEMIQYMKNVLLHYLLQVIPSTTILKIKYK